MLVDLPSLVYIFRNLKWPLVKRERGTSVCSSSSKISEELEREERHYSARVRPSEDVNVKVSRKSVSKALEKQKLKRD